MPSLERPCARHRPPVPAPMIMTLRGLLIAPPSRQTVKMGGRRPPLDRSPAVRRVIQRCHPEITSGQGVGSAFSAIARNVPPDLETIFRSLPRRDLDLDQLARPREAFNEFDLRVVERSRHRFGDAG